MSYIESVVPWDLSHQLPILTCTSFQSGTTRIPPAPGRSSLGSLPCSWPGRRPFAPEVAGVQPGRFASGVDSDPDPSDSGWCHSVYSRCRTWTASCLRCCYYCFSARQPPQVWGSAGFRRGEWIFAGQRTPRPPRHTHPQTWFDPFPHRPSRIHRRRSRTCLILARVIVTRTHARIHQAQAGETGTRTESKAGLRHCLK